MALSRTARILIAILLLAAAAFFWVNFFYQSQIAETPAQDPVTATPVPTGTDVAGVTAPDADADAAETTAETADVAAADADAEAADGSSAAAADGGAPVADGDAVTDVDAATDPDATAATADADATAAAAPAETGPSDAAVATEDPTVVVVDAAVVVSRDVVIADLPFLVTSPLPQAEVAATEVTAELPRGAVTVPTRATINPFSPVVVRTPPAPTRDVPAAGVVTDVPVPSGPSAPATVVAAPRAPAPTPRPLAPTSGVAATALTRELPTGSVLSSAPDLLRQPRVGTVADRVDLPNITAIAVPGAEPAMVARPPAPRTPVPVVDLEPVGPIAAPTLAVPDEIVVETETDAVDAEAAPAPAATAVAPPLPAGATRLARYLRDNDYAFTGSVMGPVSVGVFRSLVDSTPIVVALGQTLPNTDIVLTDLRGMQAELKLGDSTQILSLDLRR
jgi:hypothetical protein